MSADGTRVVFAPYENNLVPNDTNRRVDLFVHDLLAGVTRRVNVNTALQQGSDDLNGVLTDWIGLSADGRFVAFTSGSDLLRPNANGDTFDVFVRVAMVPSSMRSRRSIR